MIRKLRYVNSLGDCVEFGGEASPWFFGDTDIFNLRLEHEAVGGAITGFSHGIREFGLRAFMRGGTAAERNRIVDVLSYDARVARRGRLHAGDSYMECFVSGFEQSEWQYMDEMVDVDMTIVSDRPAWVRDAVATLAPSTSIPTGGLDFPHDHPHDYLPSMNANSSVVNPFMLPAKCDVTFAGPCVNPYVIIGGNRYQVNATAEKGQLVCIRGMGAKDVVLKDVAGAEQSIFAQGVRERGAMAFAEIPVGRNVASWPGAYPIEIRMYEERSVPWWT